MKIEDLGYNSFFEANKNQIGLRGFLVARVIAEYKEAYRVRSANGEYLAKITGKQMFRASGREDYPAVGDWVAIETVDNDHAVIRGILPRFTVIKRIYGNKTQIIATNIDVAFVVESVDRDDNLNRFERYFAIAESGGVKPVIILNKIDLLSKKESTEKLSGLKSRFPPGGVDAIFISTVSNEGIDGLKNTLIEARHTVFWAHPESESHRSLINYLVIRRLAEL